MQNQLVEISASLAADLAQHTPEGHQSPSAEKLLQQLPELQKQLDLAELWTQSVAQHVPHADGDSAFASYLRQSGRRSALAEVLRSRGKETEDVTLSLMEAAEWLHALKEEGRTPRPLFCYSSPLGFNDSARFWDSALLHWYDSSEGSSAHPPQQQQQQRSGLVARISRDRGLDEEEVKETLEDAQRWAPHPPRAPSAFPLPTNQTKGPSQGLRNSNSSSSSSGAGGGAHAVAAESRKGSSRSSTSSVSKHQLSVLGMRPGGPREELLPQLRREGRKEALWWEAEAATLRMLPNSPRRAAFALIPHLHQALQTGPHWDCLGEGSVEANALWLFVMGRICTSAFFCESLRSILFGETLLLKDMLKLAKRAASGATQPLSLSKVDAVLDGKQEGFARMRKIPKLVFGVFESKMQWYPSFN
ncbi:hypothetical protein Esti_005170 [Eimeria stiedai]